MEGILIIYLGIDNIRGTLVDENGVEKITIEKEISLFVNEEYIEQDPEEWYTNIIKIMDEIQSLIQDTSISSITVTYQPGTFVCVDRAGKPLLNAMLPCDRRARYQVHVCEKSIGRHLEGINVPWNCMILPKLLWVKYNKPDVYDNIFKVLTPDGYLAYKLAGEDAIDACSAMFMGYNTNTGTFNKKVLDTLEMDSSIFPRVKRIGDCVGIIAGDLKEELKLKSEVRFLMSSNCLMFLGIIASARDRANIFFDGESCSICFLRNSSRSRNGRLLVTIPYKEYSIDSIMGNYEMHFLKWAYKFIKDTGNENMAYSPGSNGVMVLPYIMGDNIPFKSDIKGSIFGIGRTSANDIITASYESIGYIIKDKLEYIMHYINQVDTLEVLCSSTDELFYQILADITGKKILILKSVSLTRCIFSMVFKGVEPDKETENETTDFFNPVMENNSKQIHLSALYKSVYDSLNNIFRYRRRVLRKVKP